jgi:hypothetical protein
MLEQLTNRKNKSSSGARVYLESKKEAKASGHPSPDRADAFVLSFVGLTIDNFLSDGKAVADGASVRKRESMGSTHAEVIENYENKFTYETTSATPAVTLGKRCFGSLRRISNN